MTFSAGEEELEVGWICTPGFEEVEFFVELLPRFTAIGTVSKRYIINCVQE